MSKAFLPARPALIAALLTALWSCGDSDSGTDPDPGPPPSISISVAPQSLTVEQGGSGSVTVSVAAENAVDAVVTLAAEGLPSGVIAPTVTAPAGATSAQLDFTASESAEVGTRTVTIRGSGVDGTGTTIAGTLTTFSLSVVAPPPPPTIEISVDPTSLSVQQGESGDVRVEVTRTGGFAGLVTVAAEGLPDGVSAQAITIAQGATSGTLTLVASNEAAVGTSALTVRATGEGVEDATSSVTLETTARPIPTVSVGVDPSTLVVEQGASGSVAVTLARGGGFDGEVALAASGLPTGVGAAFDPVGTAGESSTLTLSASADATLGESTVTVTASGEGVEGATAEFTLTVAAPPVAPSLAISLDPAQLTIEPGATSSSAATLTRSGGFAGEVSIAVSGAPQGMTAAATPNPTTEETVSVSVEVDGSVAGGSYPLTVTASGEGVENANATLTIDVVAIEPGYSIHFSPDTLTIAQGEDGFGVVSVDRVGGFAGGVGLTFVNYPIGVSGGAQEPTVFDDASDVRLSVDATAPPGTYTMELRGFSEGFPLATDTFTVVITETELATLDLTLSTNNLSIPAGGSGSVQAGVARSDGFTAPVDLVVTNAPDGVTAEVTATSSIVDGAFATPIPGSTASITINAASTVAVGTYTLVVTASAEGAIADSRAINLTVTAAPPPTGESFTWSFCPDVPSWFAIENEGVSWTQVPVTGSDVTFQVSGDRVGLAWVIVKDGKPTTHIRYAHRDEVAELGASLCNGPKTVTGAVSGLGATNTAYIALGGSTAVVSGATASSYTASSVRDGTIDLFASRTAIGFSGGQVSTTVDRLLLQRDLNPPSGGTVDVDFGSGFAPAPQDLGANGLNGEAAQLTLIYRTNGTQGIIFAETAFTGSQFRTYYGVPEAQQREGDFHLAQLTTQPDGGTLGSYRSAAVYFREIRDQDVTFGPALGATSFTTSTITPYLRPRVQYTRQSEYDRYWFVSYQQGDRTVQLYLTDDFQGSADVDVQVPDFSVAAGWDDGWGLRTTGDITYAFITSGWDAEGAIAPAALSAGLGIQTGTRTGTITP